MTKRNLRESLFEGMLSCPLQVRPLEVEVAAGSGLVCCLFVFLLSIQVDRSVAPTLLQFATCVFPPVIGVTHLEGYDSLHLHTITNLEQTRKRTVSYFSGNTVV